MTIDLKSRNFLPTEMQRLLNNVLKKYPKGSQRAAMREVLSKLFVSQVSAAERLKQVKALSLLSGVSVRVLMEIIRNDLGQEKGDTKVWNCVSVCSSVSCFLRGSNDILKACENWLGIGVGSKTIDDRFSLEKKNCLGSCTRGPVVDINGQTQGEMTPTKMVHWLQNSLSHEKPVAPSAPTVVHNPYGNQEDLE